MIAPCSRCLHASRVTGFTLLELLVVLVIVGLAGMTVLLTGPGDGNVLTREANTLAARLARAREEAILTTRAVKVTITSDGYRFQRQNFGQWQPLRDGPFEPVSFRPPTTALLPPDAAQSGISFRFDPAGASSVLAVQLERQGERSRVAVSASGEITVDALP